MRDLEDHDLFARETKVNIKTKLKYSRNKHCFTGENMNAAGKSGCLTKCEQNVKRRYEKEKESKTKDIGQNNNKQCREMSNSADLQVGSSCVGSSGSAAAGAPWIDGVQTPTQCGRRARHERPPTSLRRPQQNHRRSFFVFFTIFFCKSSVWHNHQKSYNYTIYLVSEYQEAVENYMVK